MTGLAIMAGVLVAYALFASRLDRLSITAATVFVTVGVILGPSATGLLPIALTREVGRPIVEMTLAILLFADASTVRLREAEADSVLPSRLLCIGLPLTIVAGALLARLFFPHAGWAGAALVATILAPTDAALGLAVFTNPSVPVRIRRALNLESGLNDGLATPFIALFIAILVSEENVGAGHWAIEATKEIVFALLTGVVVGVVAGRLLLWAHRRGWTSHVSEELAIFSLALLCYGGSLAVGGNGFVAAFVGGLVFASASRRVLQHAVEFTETVGLFASFVVWTLFGALLAGPVLREHIEGLRSSMRC
jgi:NhaP-type Na+/H+ or K+/H+ antiporter